MRSYYLTQSTYLTTRYAGRYVPVPLAYSVPKPVPAAEDLTDLIGIPPAWMPRRDSTTSGQSDLAMSMLQEKADLGKMTVGSLVYQIIQREQIKEDNLLRIRYQEVTVDSQIMQLESMWAPHAIPADSRTKIGLEAELIRMEQQKRAEEVECWRDISRLKEKLLESLGLYRDSARRERMVAGGLPMPAPTAERG